MPFADLRSFGSLLATPPPPPLPQPNTKEVTDEPPLDGPLWVVCAYFNPCGYGLRSTNYEIFAANLRRQKVPLLTVELASSETALQLAARHHASKYVPVISSDVLWAKECLVNIGARHLPPSCKVICWADADLVWNRDDWAALTVKQLTKPGAPVVVQPFARGTNMQQGERVADYKHVADPPTCLPMGKFYSEHPGSLINCNTPYRYHAGYAWAMRMDTFKEIGGLYEYCILGHADYVMGIAFTHDPVRDRPMFDDWNQNATFNWAPALLKHIRNWQKRASTIVRGRLGFVPNVAVFHHWHGNPNDRQYASRGYLLNDYDPDKDITHSVSDRAIHFTSSAKARQLPERIKEYFQHRKEDGR